MSPEGDTNETLIMTLPTGPVTIRLRPDLAPGHVARIKELAGRKVSTTAWSSTA